MTTSRLATLVAFMAFGFATVHLLPKHFDQPVGVRVELPEFIGSWKGADSEITSAERATLGEASGTRFARKTYRSLESYEITVSIVLSGKDMSTSIHRPERCLEAQGWSLQDKDELAVSLPNRGTFPVTQLRSTRLVKKDDTYLTRELQTFYWFAGENRICSGHWERLAIDNSDRLFRGVSQRWAFMLVSGGVPIPKDPNLTPTARQWSQNTIREFIKLLAPKIHLDTLQYN